MSEKADFFFTPAGIAIQSVTNRNIEGGIIGNAPIAIYGVAVGQGVDLRCVSFDNVGLAASDPLFLALPRLRVSRVKMPLSQISAP